MSWLLLAWLVVADGGNAVKPVITAEFANRTAFIGDAVPLTVRIYFSKGWAFDQTTIEAEQGKGQVLNQNWLPVATDPETGLQVQTLNLSVAWYELGQHSFPSLSFHGMGPDGNEVDLKTPELTMEIVPIREEGDVGLAPPKDQIDLTLPLPWLWITLGVLGVLALLGLIWVMRRPRALKVAEKTKPQLPPLDEAEQALRDLLASSLLKEGKTKQFYVEINDIIRHFFARTFRIPAEEMTSFELESFFQENHPALVDINNQFQGLCDLVKYARYKPGESENSVIVNHAHQILDVFRPKEAAHV
ncbi:MAG: hypothetical protein KDC71_02410 [Acidobacteria bacterium]|nr:hypothetical protein [Acidobacteriota bacterium]